MCGIAGGIHSGINKAQGLQALTTLKHRGPDDIGLWMNGEVWLGNTRLAIRDLSQSGHQPMRTPDGRYTLVFNGEIYNNETLRSRLSAADVQFRSSCDTETLLYAFAAWGENCLSMLEGDFAFAVFDALKNELVIARDHIGVKPLYYYWHNGVLLFASELKALLSLPGVDYTINENALAQYLVFLYSPTDLTPFRHFKKLLPGHYLSHALNNTSTTLRRYASIPFTGKYEHRSKKDWLGLLDEKLSQTVNAQLHSDAPAGFTLSGGLDSSLIVALARKAQPGGELHAFCINSNGAMKGEGFGDDFSYARIAAKHLRIQLHEVPGTLDIGNDIDRLIWQLDEPQADPAALHMGHISAAAHQMGIKVLLAGTGGDDVFSGYRRHQAIPYLRMLPQYGAGIKNLAKGLSNIFPHSPVIRRALKFAAGAGLSLEDAMIHTHFWMEPGRVAGLFNQGMLTEDASSYSYCIFKELLDEIPAEQSDLNKMLFWEQRSFLPHHNLAYMDKLGMAHSVEVRVPFADQNIVTLAASMPPGLKLRRGITKAILREVAKPYLPASIIQRKKTGFGAPLRSWIVGAGAHVVHERLLADEAFLNRGIFNREAIQSLISENQQGQDRRCVHAIFAALHRVLAPAIRASRMKQITLSFITGKPQLEDVPAPSVQRGEVLIQTLASVVSTGTERMLMDFGKAGWIGKARQQPERLKQVLEKISTDGIAPALKSVRSKLNAPIPLGYSQCGVVIGVGAGITDIRIGDRVASNGAHAAVVSVPRNLVAKIPDGVTDEAAAFTVLGAIALQGIRLAAPTFGETVVVIGLGLIGQLTAQLLLANGCRVIGVEPHSARLRKAAAMGVIAMEAATGESVRTLTTGHGADAVIITASGGNGLIEQAADMCRKRGRIVLTGVTDMQLSREQFFKKELTFQVSASYGPGRYEPGYETHGLDYPIGFVRWTEGRNFEAVLSAMASGKLDVASLITVRKSLPDFEALYEALELPEHLAGLITYNSDIRAANTIFYINNRKPATGAGFGLIGAGSLRYKHVDACLDSSRCAGIDCRKQERTFCYDFV